MSDLYMSFKSRLVFSCFPFFLNFFIHDRKRKIQSLLMEFLKYRDHSKRRQKSHTRGHVCHFELLTVIDREKNERILKMATRKNLEKRKNEPCFKTNISLVFPGQFWITFIQTKPQGP